MEVCRTQRTFFESNIEQNLIVCQNYKCEHNMLLVNAFICHNCPYKDLIYDPLWIDEPAFEPRTEETVKYLFKTSCQTCSDFNPNRQTCNRIKGSKTMYELLEHPDSKCPRSLW